MCRRHHHHHRHIQYITHMVNNSGLYCRIDRPQGTVAFKPKPMPGEVLNTWSHGVDQLLGLVDEIACDSTCICMMMMIL